jgi:ATP-dependent RNA helicase SUPV3L1/SUV3
MDAALAERAIDANLWARCVARLRGEVLNRPQLAFQGDLEACHGFLRYCARYAASANPQYLAALVPRVIGTAERHFRPILEAAKVLRQTADLRNPASWYPEARKMKRKIVLHTGPTNSGKTYQALQSLKAAPSGLYCGPLRLLALEVYETLNQQGAITNLVTGQERRELMFASHTSCTVEMTNVEKEYDVGVIDEVQMMGDEQRGWAWTRALLGMRAKEIHLCGDPAAAPVVRKLAAACGDELEERAYERLTPLRVAPKSLGGSLRNVRKGDAIVAFRRRDIYQIRRLIERLTGHKCCVVYGRLPPETRNAQARLFNDPGSGYDVLVASDAIGMGLNLNIRRVVFSEVTKFNGTNTALLSTSQLKQIAGRAGRAGGIYPEGVVTVFEDEDMPLLRAGLDGSSETVVSAGLQPNTEQVVQFADSWRRMHGSVPALSRLLSNFIEASQLDGDYFMCDAGGVRERKSHTGRHGTAWRGIEVWLLHQC